MKVIFIITQIKKEEYNVSILNRKRDNDFEIALSKEFFINRNNFASTIWKKN